MFDSSNYRTAALYILIKPVGCVYDSLERLITREWKHNVDLVCSRDIYVACGVANQLNNLVDCGSYAPFELRKARA